MPPKATLTKKSLPPPAANQQVANQQVANQQVANQQVAQPAVDRRRIDAALAVYAAGDASPIPFAAAATFGAFKSDPKMYPPKKYRFVDYALTACKLFVDELKTEYAKQRKRAERDGKPFKKLTWSNSGDLAINFAMSCDMLKLLYDRLAAPKPFWESFVQTFIRFLMRESAVPTDVLTEKTYDIKFKDWKKGGTRYNDEHAHNIRFPSYDERKAKLEAYMADGSVLEIQSTIVDEVRAVAPFAAAGAAAAIAVPAGPGPVRVPVRVAQGSAPPIYAAVKSIVGNNPRNAKWTEDFSQIKGSSDHVLIPPEKVQNIPALIELMGERTETSMQYKQVIEVVCQSHETIQRAFERHGGLLIVRKWADNLIKSKNETTLMFLIDKIIKLGKSMGPSWSEASRQAWLQSNNGLEDQSNQPELMWLRSCDFITTQHAQLWKSQLTTLQKILLNEFDTFSDRKRERGADGFLQRSFDSNQPLSAQSLNSYFIFQNGVATCCCLREPVELAMEGAEAARSAGTQLAVELVNARLSYANKLQKRWEKQVSDAAPSGVSLGTLPLWYDPYAMLGIPSQVIRETNAL